MKKAVIVDGLRTPFLKAGSVPNLNAVTLASSPVEALLAKYGDLYKEIDYVIGANIGNQMLSPDGSNFARVFLLNAGLPKKIGAWTLNINCATSLHAIIDAAKTIELGLAKCVLVVAAEVVSDFTGIYSREQRQVWNDLMVVSRNKKTSVKKLAKQAKLLSKLKLMPHKPIWELDVALTDPVTGLRMDQASNLLAKEWDISREEQDLYAYQSQQRAANAAHSGRLGMEISPLEHLGETYEHDNGIRADSSLSKLAKLKPLYPDGTITAGNSSQITDGACALIIAEEEFAESMSWEAQASVSARNSGLSGCEPERFGLAPVLAIKQVLDRMGTNLKDFDLIESNEAFAAVVLAQSRALASADYCESVGLGGPIGELAFDITNVNGGAIAIGHPFSASGARLVLTCMRELEYRDKELGLVTICIGGGQGEALAIERSG